MLYDIRQMDGGVNSKQEVSLREVAKLADVSIATASLALRNKAGSLATKEKVLRAAKQLGYVASSAARTLKSGRSSVIGIYIFSNPDGRNYADESAFFYQFIKSVADTARINNHGVLIEDIPWDVKADENNLLKHIRGGYVDGVILIPQFDYPYYFLDEIERTGIAYCICNPADTTKNLFSISFDNTAAARLAVTELLSRPVKHLAIVHGPVNHVEAKMRAAGAADITADLKDDISISIHYGDFTIESGYEIGNRIFATENHPDAVYAANDYMAVGIMRSAIEHSLRIPTDVRIVGTDDNEVCRAVTPQLTTVRNPIYKMGVLAVESIFTQLSLESEATGKNEKTIKAELIIRGSC